MKIEIFEKAFRVTVDGNIVKLTRKEFQILKMLVDANGDPVSSENMMKNLYSCGFRPESNREIIKVFICNLRKKLGGANKIQTILGSGYALRLPFKA